MNSKLFRATLSTVVQFDRTKLDNFLSDTYQMGTPRPSMIAWPRTWHDNTMPGSELIMSWRYSSVILSGVLDSTILGPDQHDSSIKEIKKKRL